MLLTLGDQHESLLLAHIYCVSIFLWALCFILEKPFPLLSTQVTVDETNTHYTLQQIYKNIKLCVCLIKCTLLPPAKNLLFPIAHKMRGKGIIIFLNNLA